jgi:drug/metabolite transporter (DMT)-like permease
MIAALPLLGRVALSAAASVLQKKITSAGVDSAQLWKATYGWMALPAALALVLTWRQSVASGFWFNAIVAGLLDAVGNLAMVAALRSTHLSIFGPLNGFRPLLALVFGWIVLGEQPSALGIAGVLITVVGVALLLRDEESDHSASQRGRMLALRVLGLALSTFAAVFLKRAVLAAPTGLTLGVWVLCGLPVFWIFSLLTARSARDVTPATENPFLSTHAALFFVMQWLTLEVFRTTLLAYSFAFFQLGMVLQVVLGHWLFHEPHFARRLLCCAIIGLGALLITAAL